MREKKKKQKTTRRRTISSIKSCAFDLRKSVGFSACSWAIVFSVSSVSSPSQRTFCTFRAIPKIIVDVARSGNLGAKEKAEGSDAVRPEAFEDPQTVADRRYGIAKARLASPHTSVTPSSNMPARISAKALLALPNIHLPHS